VLIDQTAEPNPGESGRYQEDSSHHSGCQHRLGLQEHPEGDGEPGREVDDRYKQRVDQQLDEGAICAALQIKGAD